MRKNFGWAAIALIALLFVQGEARASLIGAPRALRGAVEHISFGAPVLAPLAFTRFCLSYAGDCRPLRMMFRGTRLKMTAERWRDLSTVNRQVNSAIAPERNANGLLGEEWIVSPAAGDCNDFAVTILRTPPSRR